MSKIAKAIKAVDSGERILINRRDFKYTDIKSDWMSIPTEAAKKYRIGMSLTTDAYIDDNPTSKVDTFSLAIQDAKKGMVEEIFGEFRPLIYELRNALYDKDTFKARELLAQLEYQMFTDGIE